MSDIDLSDDVQLASHVAQLIDGCEKHADDQEKSRQPALEYYDGIMTDTPFEAGRTGVVSHDLRAAIKKIMPTIMRTLLSGDKIVEFEPAGPGPDKELQAQQATDYMNHVVVPEAGVEGALYDAIFDALVVKTGILKWRAYNRREATVQQYTSQSDAQLLGLGGEDGVEIADLVSEPETDAVALAENPAALRHSFSLRRVVDQVDVRLEAIPRGSFLIHPTADSIEESPIVGERQVVTRSELVSRGYDRDLVASLAAYAGRDHEESDNLARKGEDWSDERMQTAAAMEEVLLHEVYVRLDLDGDGIAELHKVCMAEGSSEEGAGPVVLDREPVAEAPYAKVIAEREAHQFEGRSLAEDVVPIQKIKTGLVRQTLDNLVWANNPTPVVDGGALTTQGIEAMQNPSFGKIVEAEAGRAKDAVQFLTVPFVGEKSFGMLQYLDEELRERTGVTDQSGGLDPEAFQNMTATSVQLMAESGIAQAEMIVRSLSRGIRKAFKGLLRLVIAHSDRERAVRLRGEWIDYDPRHWDVDMDCVVNVGLGAGSKERDLAVLQMVHGLQEKLLAAFGPDNPYVKPEQVFNVLDKITETAGFPDVKPYFTRPDPQEVQARLQAEAQKPSEHDEKVQLEQMKAQAKAQADMAKAEIEARFKRMEMDHQIQLERIKAEQQAAAAAAKEEAQARWNSKEQEFKAQLDAATAERDLALKREQMAADTALRREQIAADERQNALNQSVKMRIEAAKLPPEMQGGLGGFADQLDASVNARPILSDIAAIKDSLAAITEALTRAETEKAAPRQILRDEAGQIIGAQVVMPDGTTIVKELQRDEHGNAVGSRVLH